MIRYLLLKRNIPTDRVLQLWYAVHGEGDEGSVDLEVSGGGREGHSQGQYEGRWCQIYIFSVYVLNYALTQIIKILL